MKKQERVRALYQLYRSFPKGFQPPKAVERTLLAALALPPDHNPRMPFVDERRGKPRYDACFAAEACDVQYYEKHGQLMPTGDLKRELKDIGYDVSKKSIRDWRKRPSWMQGTWVFD